MGIYARQTQSHSNRCLVQFGLSPSAGWASEMDQEPDCAASHRPWDLRTTCCRRGGLSFVDAGALMAMTSVPGPNDSRRVAPHEETIVSSHSSAGSGSGSKSSQGGSSLGAGLHEAQVPAPVTVEEFSHSLTASGLMSRDELNSFCETIHDRDSLTDANSLADLLVKANKLTPYQADNIRLGHSRGLVLGNYIILEKLGEGGMGMVFKARHRLMKRIVALKVLPPSMTQSADAVARFHREVEAAATLQHPNIAGAFDADQADGIHFMVMEYVEGPNLSSLVKDVGPLTPPVAMNIISQAARGLLHAHEHRVVHRDIKPGNLLVSNNGVVKVLDMGLAQLQSAEENNGQRAELTQSGRIMGTVDYMAPEQALDAKTVDQRADVYSLGCTLYYLLTGKPLSPDGTLTQKLLWHQTEPVPSLRSVSPEVPEALDTLFQHMVAKKVDDRIGSMAEVIAQIDPLLADIPPEQLKLPSGGVGLSNEKGSVTDYSGRGKLTMVDRATRSDMSGALGLQDSERPEPSPISAANGTSLAKLLPLAIVLGLAGLAVGVGAFMFFAPLKQNKNPMVMGANDKAKLVIAANHPNARVFINEKEHGQTDGAEPFNLEVDLPPGDYQIRVQKEGFAKFEQKVTLQEGKSLTLKAPLGAQPATINLTVDVAEARVFIDSRRQDAPAGKGPYRLTIRDVEPGSRIVRIEAEGFEPKDEKIILKPGDKLELSATLVERPFRALLEKVFANADSEGDAPVIVVDTSGNVQPAKRWSDLPAKYREIRELNLAKSAFQDTDLELLKRAESLQALSLAETKIGDEGVKAIAALSNLERLNLSKTAVGDKNLSYLTKLAKLTNLDLRQTKVTDTGMQSLAELPAIKGLHLSGTSIGDIGVKEFTKTKSLKTLSVDGTRVTFVGYESLNTFPTNPINKAELDPELGIAYRLLRGGAAILVVREVDAGGESKRVEKLTDLPPEKLHVTGIVAQGSSEVDDVLLKDLMALPKLTEIDLDGSAVTENGLLQLRKVSSLKKINLGYLRVAKSSVDGLRQALPQAADNITWKGPRDRVAAEWVLAQGGKVRVIVSEPVFVSDAKQLPENRDFRLDEIHLVNKADLQDNDLAVFKDLSELTLLNLVGSAVSEAGLKQITGATKLNTLCLSGEKTNSKSLAVLATLFPQLERLYIADSAVDGIGLNPLKKLNKLTRLSLAGTAVKDADMATLAALPNLQWLSLDGTTLTDGAIVGLSQLKQLKVLSLDDESLAPEAKMMDAPLPDSPERRHLQITDAGLEELKLALKQTQIYHRALDPQRLAARWVLEQGGSVTVSSGDYPVTKVSKLDNLPRSACQVKEVSLRDTTRFSPEQLAPQLRVCKQLSLLDLGGTKVVTKNLGALTALTELQSLNLSSTDVDDDAFVQLSSLPKLRVLGLQSTFVTGSGLAKHPLSTLTHLYVGTTSFDDEGLKFLKDSPDLVELDLSNCGAITDKGLLEIAGLTKLQRLELVGTRITDAAGETLGKLKALRRLNLYGLPISDGLVAALTEMPNLEEVNLAKTKVSDAALAQLASCPKLKVVSAYSTAVTEGGAQVLRDKKVKVNKSTDPGPRDQNTTGAPGRF